MKRELMRYMRLAKIVALGTAMLSLAGCVKRDLEMRPDEGYVEIALDWTKTGMTSHSARYLFYNEAGMLVREVSGITDCFKGTLPTGTYHLVVHNTDAEGVDFRGTEAYHTAEVFAKQTNYSEGHHPEEGVPCVQEPRAVFAAGSCKESETIKVEQLATTRLTVAPEELTKAVKFRFTVNSSEPVQSLTGVLNGVAPGMFLSARSCNASSSCAMEWTAERETAAGLRAAGTLYRASVNVFGLLAAERDASGATTLHAVLTLESGFQVSETFDLTEVIRRIAADNGGVLPDEISVEVILHIQGASLEATVAPWDESGTGSGDLRPQA